MAAKRKNSHLEKCI